MSEEANVTPATDDPAPSSTPVKKKRHRRTQAEMAAAKAAEGAPVKKRHRRTKAEIEAAKASGEGVKEKKRHRRTKAEIEAAKAAGEKAPAKKAVKKAAEPTEKRKRKTKVDIINVTAKKPEKNTRDGRKWPAVYMSLFATIRTKAPKAVAKDFQDFCEKHQNVEED